MNYAEDHLRLRALFDSMAEGVIVQDESGAVVSTNAAAQRILKVRGNPLEGQSAHGPPIAPLVRRDGSPMPDDERPAAHVLRTGESVTDRIMGLRMPDGGTTWISVNATPLRLEGEARPSGAVLTFRDLTEQIVLEEALAQSLGDFGKLVATLPVGIAVSHGRTMRYVNRALVEMLGYDDASELEGHETLKVIHPSSEQAILQRYAGMAEGKHPGPGILHCRKKDGSSVLVEVTSMPSGFEGKPAILAIIRDVTEAARAREALVESLAQKETLLQEIHHRVKNNLQVIASLLRLGRGYVQDPGSLSVFNDSIARIHSIALIHERLYQSPDLDRIEMSEYLRGLLSELIRANTTHHRVATQVLVDRLFLNMDRCVPIGLIVNELVSNALKHAFGTDPPRPPAIVIGLAESAANYELVVQDNGVGFDGIGPREGSLGLKIVASLAQQLGGEHRVVQERGTAWSVVFPKGGVGGDAR